MDTFNMQWILMDWHFLLMLSYSKSLHSCALVILPIEQMPYVLIEEIVSLKTHAIVRLLGFRVQIVKYIVVTARIHWILQCVRVMVSVIDPILVCVIIG